MGWFNNNPNLVYFCAYAIPQQTAIFDSQYQYDWQEVAASIYGYDDVAFPAYCTGSAFGRIENVANHDRNNSRASYLVVVVGESADGKTKIVSDPVFLRHYTYEDNGTIRHGYHQERITLKR